MPRHAAVLLLAAAALAASSCDDVNTRLSINQPTPIHTVQTASFVPSTSSVFAQPVDLFRCPAVAPFNIQLNLVVHAGDVSLVVTQFRLVFTDTSGSQAPQVTLPAPVPTTQFGSALVAARSAQTFPLAFGLGCGTGHTGTLVIIVDTKDETGRMDSGQISVAVH
ncbi:MAG TPA: hypothetical protein VFK20_07170 [Vicinamibacterales bacterium]|nr:hypothetical protein [Vicinamibacterales bacterium]